MTQQQQDLKDLWDAFVELERLLARIQLIIKR